MNNNLEKLIDSLPEHLNIRSKNEKGEEIIRTPGLCIRYSTRSGMWLAGYGRKLVSPHSSKKHHDWVGLGYTPIEALDDLISKRPSLLTK
jgi:hypothetical protein